MISKETKREVVKTHLEDAHLLMSIAEKINDKRIFNKAKKIAQQAEDTLSRLADK